MRAVGVALFASWLIAWGLSPKGEPARPTSTVGGLAIAGSDDVAVAWLEVSHARPRSSEVLHVATIDPAGRVTPRIHLDGHDDVAYRLAESAPGRFLLVSEHRTRLDRWFEVRTFASRAAEGAVASDPHRLPARLPDLRATFNASSWEVAASGGRLALVEEELGGGTSVHMLDGHGDWAAAESVGRTLVASGHGSLVRYEVGRRDDLVEITPESGSPWVMRISHPRCAPPRGGEASEGEGPAEGARAAGSTRPIDRSLVPPMPPAAPAANDGRERVLSVTGLPGGYARMARLGRWLCVDGMRAGRYFRLDPVPLGEVVDPRLTSDADARLFLLDGNDGKGALFTRQLEFLPTGASPYGWARRPLTLPGSDGVRGYAIFQVTPAGGAALVTRAVAGQTQVLLDRFQPGDLQPAVRGPLCTQSPSKSAVRGASATAATPSPRAASEILLGPPQRMLPDRRPLLRWLALLPLLALAAALARSLRLLSRLRALAPGPSHGPLPEGRAVVAASLALDADAPAGALRLRRAGQSLLLFIDQGAEVLRASDVRPRSEPRGDAVDVASGAPVLATGVVARGAAFRGQDSLRAGDGDLVLVGCTLGEARARVATRVAASGALLACALGSILMLIK